MKLAYIILNTFFFTLLNYRSCVLLLCDKKCNYNVNIRLNKHKVKHAMKHIMQVTVQKEQKRKAADIQPVLRRFLSQEFLTRDINIFTIFTLNSLRSIQITIRQLPPKQCIRLAYIPSPRSTTVSKVIQC